MDVFCKNIQNPDYQIQVQTLESIYKELNSYVDSNHIFTYSSEDQVDTFFKTDLYRFTNLLVGIFPKDFNELALKNNIFLLLSVFSAILNKNIFSICFPFSSIIVGLKKLVNFDESFYNELLTVDLIMNLTESFNNSPSMELLDFILLISTCIDSEESQIDRNILFAEISESTSSLFDKVDFNKYDNTIISRVFNSSMDIITDLNTETDVVIDESFYICFINTLVKILQCNSFEKQKFAIRCFENLLKNNTILYFKWSMQVNPFITLNNIEGIDQIVIEISHLIQTISGLQIIDIDKETLESLLHRIDDADLSQKKTFTTNFGVVASNADEDIVLSVIKNYIDNHSITPEFYSFLGSISIRTLNTKPTVSKFIIDYLESKIPEFYNSNIIDVLKDFYCVSSEDRNRILSMCLNHFNDIVKKVPKYVYFLIMAILPNFTSAEASNFLNSMIYHDNKDEPLYDQLLSKIVLKCPIPLEKNQAIFLLKKMTENEQKLDILFEIMKIRETNIIKIQDWITQIKSIVSSDPIQISLKFTNNVLPHFYYLPYQTYTPFFVDVFLSLMKRYIFENDEQIRTDIFCCFFTHFIMANCSIRHTFLCELFPYFESIYQDQLEYTILSNTIDFIYKTIIRSEYYINDDYFQIHRHRPIKKEKGGFDLPFLHIMPGLIMHVYPTTIVRDILYTVSLYTLNANLFEISLKKFDDISILDNNSTLADNDINASTELEIQNNSPCILLVDIPILYSKYITEYMPNELHFIISTLFEQKQSDIDANESFAKFLKSVWKLIKILPTLTIYTSQLKNTDFLFDTLFGSENKYKQLFFIQEVASQAKNDSSYLSYLYTNDLLKNIAYLLFDKNTGANVQNEALKILIYYSQKYDNFDYLNTQDLIKIISILIDSFISAKKIKTQKLILKLMNLFFNSNSYDPIKEKLAQLLIANDQFFRICIFTKESLIAHSLKLFSNLGKYSDKILFHKFASYFDQIMSSDSSIILTEDYFSLFGEIMTSSAECDNEIEEIFQKCVAMLNEFDFKWYDRIAYLVSILMKNLDKKLTEDSIIELITFVFDGNEHVQHPSIFSILTLVFQSSDIRDSFYYHIAYEYIEQFKTDRWSYSPSNHKKFENYCGLRNLGSTCYMNSILQLLENNNDFFNRVFSIQNPTPIVDQIRNLFANLECSVRSFVNTEPFADHWKEHEYPSYDPRIQEDAAEFLHIFLDKLPDEIKEPFSGNLINSFNGITVDFHHDIQERFYTLEIPILPNFYESMQSIVKPQMFIGNNQYMSEENGKIDVKRTTKIIQFPRTLVIQLKRFDFNIKEGKRTKIYSEFMFPLSFNTKECFPNIDENQIFDYILTGVITHSGTADGGHYNAIKRNFSTSNIADDENWICFNDSEVSQMTKERFWSVVKGDANSQVAAYLLFYEWNDSTFRNELLEDKKQKISSDLQESIANENHEMHQIQNLFTEPMMRFIMSISDPAILVKYYTHVMCHSNSFNLINLFSNSIIKQCDINANLVAENFNEEHHEIFDSLVNANNEIATSLINVLSYIYRIDNKVFDVNKMSNITSNLVNYLKNYISLWRVYERFGKIAEVVTSNYIELAVEYNYFDSIIEIMSDFYNVTTGTVALESISLAPFINCLSMLFERVNDKEKNHKLMLFIRVHGAKVKQYQPTFIVLLNKIYSFCLEEEAKNAIAKTPTNEILTMDKVVDSYFKCNSNQEFFELFPLINKVGDPQTFIKAISESKQYHSSTNFKDISLLPYLILFFTTVSGENAQKYVHHITYQFKYEIKRLQSDSYFSRRESKFNQYGSDVQEGLAKMITAFGFDSILYHQYQHISLFFIYVCSYASRINDPKDENVAWFNHVFDTYFQQDNLAYLLDLLNILFNRASIDIKMNFLEPRINVFTSYIIDNQAIEYYFDFIAIFYNIFGNVLQIRPDLFSILIQPGDNLNSFLYNFRNIRNGDTHKNRDDFINSIKDILPKFIDSSIKDAPRMILKIFNDIIDIVFNDSKIFPIVDKLVDYMDDDCISMYIEKLFIYSSSIVTNCRVPTTLNIMTKITMRTTVLNVSQKLVDLAPKYLVFFNTTFKDQIPKVIDFASVLCDKCHPIGNALFDQIVNVLSITDHQNMTKWELLAAATAFCHDPNRVIIVADRIIEAISETDNVKTLFKGKGIIDCICGLNEFPIDDQRRNVISVLSGDKLEQIAEICIEKISDNENESSSMQYLKILMLIKKVEKFDIKTFVKKHEDFFMRKWPGKSEHYRSLFINI